MSKVKMRATTIIAAVVTTALGLSSGVYLGRPNARLREGFQFALGGQSSSVLIFVVSLTVGFLLLQLYRRIRAQRHHGRLRIQIHEGGVRVKVLPARLRVRACHRRARILPTGAQAMVAGTIAVITVFGLSCGFFLSRVNAMPFNFQRLTFTVRQWTFTGGNNSTLGSYGSVGVQFSLSSDTTLTLGTTFTQVMGLEPLVIFRQNRQLGSDWTLNWTLSRGDFGGDYRVERVPDLTIGRGGHLGSLAYSFGVGAGYFFVRPVGVEGFRWTADAQMSTPAFPIGSFTALSASTGIHQATYSGGATNGAWWGNVQLDINPAGSLSTTFTYFRQTAKGSSPLLFDNVGTDEYVSGLATLKMSDNLSISHRLTYSIISQTTSARIYTVTFLLGPGQGAAISWDAVPQKLSLSYSRADLGTVSLGYEMPTRLITLWYQR